MTQWTNNLSAINSLDLPTTLPDTASGDMNLIQLRFIGTDLQPHYVVAVQIVPEPGSILLMVVGFGVAAAHRRLYA